MCKQVFKEDAYAFLKRVSDNCLAIEKEEAARKKQIEFLDRKCKHYNNWHSQFIKHLGNGGWPKLTDTKKTFIDRFMSFEYNKEKEEV